MAVSAHSASPLSLEQRQRYARQIVLREVGLEGQRRLMESSVLVVGAGGLGSAAAIYLAAGGVGTIGLVDDDVVDLSNLHRQILYHVRDIGRAKTQSARQTLEDLDPGVTVVAFQTTLSRENAMEIVNRFEVVVDGTDNFPARYLLSDACVLLHKPLVEASVLGWEGQATVFLPGRGCYRCLFPTPPPPGTVPSCAEAGILGAVAGHMGTVQAIEAVKVLLGHGNTLANRLLVFDALEGEVCTIQWVRDPRCPVCGDLPTITGLIDYDAFCGMPARKALP